METRIVSEAVRDRGFETVEERAVGVQDQRRYRRRADDLPDEVNRKQGFPP